MKRCLTLLLTLSLVLALAACGAPAASQSDASASSSQGETASSHQDTSSAQTEPPAQNGDAVQSGSSAQTGTAAMPNDLNHRDLVDVYDVAYAYYDQTGPTVLHLDEVAPQVGEVAFLVSFMEDTEADRTLELARQDGQWVVVFEG